MVVLARRCAGGDGCCRNYISQLVRTRTFKVELDITDVHIQYIEKGHKANEER